MEPAKVATKEEVKVPEKIKSDTKLRAFGSVVGAFVGDAAGSVLEFMDIQEVRERIDEALKLNGGGLMNMGRGQITDDSEMAMCILHGLVNEYNSETLR